MFKQLVVGAAVFAALGSFGGDLVEAASHWTGAKVAFLGDSITDPQHIGTTRNYWQYLGSWLKLDYASFGINGARFIDQLGELDRAEAKYGQTLEAVFLFAGTNDFFAGVPLGEWFFYDSQSTNRNGQVMRLRHRSFNLDPNTFRGSVNAVLAKAKAKFPQAQIVLLTPLHRGFAKFGSANVQPPEDFANTCGLFIEDYMRAVKEAGELWSVPVIDLGGECGLFPLEPALLDTFADAKNDQLHPNARGHYRMAATILGQLTRLPRWDFTQVPSGK